MINQTQLNFLKKNISKNLDFENYVILPLYSKSKNEKIVHLKSGLNQWNAEGRIRNPNEVYIPIPKWIHQKFPSFFPGREVYFSLYLPDGKFLQVKLCQANSKALMSKHNSELGKWILRDILNIKEKQIITYEILKQKGINSVIIKKIDNDNFSININSFNSYEDFEKKHNI